MLLRSGLHRSSGDAIFRGRDAPPRPASPGEAEAEVVDAEGYTPNLRELVQVLHTPHGLQRFKDAYRENMRYKVERYGRLAVEADEEVQHQKQLLRLKVPDLKATSQVSGDQDNWQIFETVSKGYREAKDRASAFDAIRQRAEQRLGGDMQWSQVLPQDTIGHARDSLVDALRTLTNFSAQSHIVSSVTDIIAAFLKNPKLIQTKFLNFMMVGAAGTGKTTLAAAIARAFSSAGMFVDDKVTDAGRAEFVGEYEGQTVARTRHFLISNLDRGVVFVDEAYAITPWADGKPEGYGAEAVTAMVEFMSHYKGLYCLICSGYEREMTRYFLPTNPGLPRRFPYRFALEDLSPDDLVHVFQRTLLTEQGIQVPTGRQTALASEAYFEPAAWEYLRALLEVATTSGATVWDDEEYDRATRKTYTHVRRFVPAFPRLYTLFENQAGSMTNLAEEAATVLMRAVPYDDAATAAAAAPTTALMRTPARGVAVLRQIVVQRIRHSALSDVDAFLDELTRAEARM